jgi:hypothetical protein
MVAGMAEVADGVEESAGDLLSTVPLEDSGAQTLDRYEWQVAMATADLLAAYTSWLESGRPAGFDFLMVCEWHEDWVLSSGPTAELVSAKHREPQSGPYTTLRQLLGVGGVLKLMGSWIRLARQTRCRLVTTMGLARPLKSFRSACEHFNSNGVSAEGIDKHRALLEELCRTVTDMEGSCPLDVPGMAAFLGCLEISEGNPLREYVPDAAPSRFARPAATALGRPGEEHAVWEAARVIVGQRMRAAGPRRRAGLPKLFGERPGPDVERRIVTVHDVHDAVGIALRYSEAYRPPPRTYDLSELGIKLTAGDLSDNVIAQAQMFRRRYVQLRQAAVDIPGEGDRFDGVERALLALVRDAEQVEASGRVLWYEIDRQVRHVAGTDAFAGFDADTLLGAVADLTQQCHVWFSHRFDVRAQRRELRTSGGRVN